MTMIRWVGGLLLLLVLGATGADCGPSEGAELPIPAPVKPEAKPAHALHRTCVGTDGKSFRWDSANVPFAAICTFDEDPPAKPEPLHTPK